MVLRQSRRQAHVGQPLQLAIVREWCYSKSCAMRLSDKFKSSVTRRRRDQSGRFSS